MRLKSEIWVKAYVRRCAADGSAAFIVRRGDADAGSIFIRVNRLDGTSILFGPASAGLESADVERRWSRRLGPDPVQDQDVDSYMAREIGFDPDIWLVEVEDRCGRHFLDDWLADD
jgi:hypothetical protein